MILGHISFDCDNYWKCSNAEKDIVEEQHHKKIFIMGKEARHFLCQVLLIAKNITAAIFQYLCVIKIFFPLHWDSLELNDGV